MAVGRLRQEIEQGNLFIEYRVKVVESWLEEAAET